MTVWPNGSKTIPRVTSEYGARTPIDTNGDGKPDTSNFHAGIDLVGWTNNKAPFAGRVIFARYNGGAGNEIRIQAANGDVARIKHNARFLVSEGQLVAEGQDVGVMGTTGASTGIHCHFETWPGNRNHINPRVYMAAALAGGGLAGGGISPLPPEGNTYMDLKRVIFDQGPNTAKGFASTAIITPVTGFVQTSEGYGPRGALEAWTAIAGVLGFPVTEAHVNADGWTLSQLFKPPAATVDAKTITDAITKAVEGIDLPDDEPLSDADIARIAEGVRTELGNSIVNG